MNSAVVARNLGKRYGRAWGLRECTLDLPAGSVVALVGPNGAGKSTLLNLLVGLLRPSTGELSVFGRPVRAVRHRIGYLDQEHAIYRSFRVGEMLTAGARLNERWD